MQIAFQCRSPTEEKEASAERSLGCSGFDESVPPELSSDIYRYLTAILYVSHPSLMSPACSIRSLSSSTSRSPHRPVDLQHILHLNMSYPAPPPALAG